MGVLAADESGGGEDDCKCSYCEECNVDSVVKCNICFRWFCNTPSGTCSSHIIYHLVKSKHKEVALHQNSRLGDITLECYHCGKTNIFLLGFIPAKLDNVVIIICREPCLTDVNFNDPRWDPNKWKPLIQQRSLLPWLVKISDELDTRINQSIIDDIEAKWAQESKTKSLKKNPDKYDKTQEIPLTRIKNTYIDGFEYQNIMAPILQVEAETDRLLKEAQKQENVTIKWDFGPNNVVYANFYHAKDDYNFKFVNGDEFRIKYTKDNYEWESIAYAIVNEGEILTVQLKGRNRGGPWDLGITEGFHIEYVWKKTPFERIHQALISLASDASSCSGYIYHKLMGHEVNEPVIKSRAIEEYSAPGLNPLNASQKSAVKHALENALTLIQGPPGTGKTLTCASIIYHMANSGENQILVAAPSNVAVDNLALQVAATGLEVIRVYSRSKESVSSSASHLSLHNRIRKVNLSKKGTNLSAELNSLLDKKDEMYELSDAEEKRLKYLKGMAERSVLHDAHVICTTCVGAGDSRLSNFRFRHVVIDEAGQCVEPEALIPVMLGAKQLVLVGDHCQLGPVVVSKQACKMGFTRSLFERLLVIGNRPLRLEVQYRMHPCLAEFPSFAFYQGALQNGVSLRDRYYNLSDFKWPVASVPTYFYNTIGEEELSSSGTSYLNRAEAVNIEKMITLLLKSGLKSSQIGVITPYQGQRSYISALLEKQTSLFPQTYRGIEVASVDAFQGREKDFILLSCVRSNKDMGIGFLSDKKRLNVALTRAKYGLIICGNAKVLANIENAKPTDNEQKLWAKDALPSNNIWANLIYFYYKQNLIVEGPLTSYRTSSLRVPNPQHVKCSYYTLDRSEQPDYAR